MGPFWFFSHSFRNGCNYSINNWNIWNALLQALEQSAIKMMSTQSLLEVGFPSPLMCSVLLTYCEILMKSHCVGGYETAMKGFACITKGLLLISSCIHTLYIKTIFCL